MVVNIIAHMVHSPPIHNDCFVNKDFIIIIIIIIIVCKISHHSYTNLTTKILTMQYECDIKCNSPVFNKST